MIAERLRSVKYPISSLEFAYAIKMEYQLARELLLLAETTGYVKFENALYWPDDKLIKEWR